MLICSLSVSGLDICWVWNSILAINRWVVLQERGAGDLSLLHLLCFPNRMHLNGCRSKDRETCWKQLCCSKAVLPSALTSGFSTASSSFTHCTIPRVAKLTLPLREALTSFLAPLVLHPNMHYLAPINTFTICPSQT